MKYNTLQRILPNHEIHYIDDCEVFFNQNLHLYDSYLEDYKFILFEYTIECFPETIKLLKSNNIKYLIKTDELGLDIILI